MQIVWFRRDLRITDNEILSQAVQSGEEIVPCFVVDPWFYGQSHVAPVRIQFLLESLSDLDHNLRSLGSKLFLFEGQSVEIIQNLTKYLLELGESPRLLFNRDAQVNYGISRDREIIEFYEAQNLEVYLGKNHFVQDREDYKLIWQDSHCYQESLPHPKPQFIDTPQLNLRLSQLTIKQLWQKYCPQAQQLDRHFIGGEAEAQKTLDSFLQGRYQGYHWKISRPFLVQMGATSRLSPHLKFGTISSRTVYQATKKLKATLPQDSKQVFSLKAFLDRLRWHDKFTQRHYFHPELAFKNRYPEFDSWYSDRDLATDKQAIFNAWCQGTTGFPLVDAAMRQLNNQGWMSFRMRAMCVSFLCINGGVSWQHGADYFMSRLVDGDIAINHRQWQNQAGVTNPMSKTFRIYNPTKNWVEKDPKSKFVTYWIPEIKPFTRDQILAGEHLEGSGCSYPAPILDWCETRKTNGKIISDLRTKVRERLKSEEGTELEIALGTKNTVEKYFAAKERDYKRLRPSK